MPPNPVYQKYDALFGKTTPTVSGAMGTMPTWSDRIQTLSKNNNPKSDSPGFFERVGKDFNDRQNNAADAQLAAIRGDETPLRATAHTMGQAAAFGGDIIGEGMKSVFNALPNHEAEGAALANDPIVQLGAHALKAGGDLWASFEKAHPEAADYLGSIGNVASILPIGAGTKIAGEGLEQAGKVGIELAAKTPKAIGGAVDAVKAAPNKIQLAATKGNQIPTLENAAQKVLPIPGDTGVIDPLARYNEHVTAQERSLADAKADPALGGVGSKIGDAFKDVVAQRKQAGEKMGSEIEKIGEKGTDASSALSAFDAELKSNGVKVGGKDFDGEGLQQSPTSKLSDSDITLLTDYKARLDKLGPNPSIGQLDAFLSRAPDELNVYKAKNNIIGTTNGERIVKNNMATLRKQFDHEQTGKGYLKDYSEARTKYADLSKFIEEGVKHLGTITQSGDFAKDASLAKSSVQSMLNNGKKDWLIKLEEHSGYPAIHDAVLALQAMKDTGDFRGGSMLELLSKSVEKGEIPHIPTSLLGMLNHAAGAVLKKGGKKLIGTPVEQTRRFLESIRK